MGHFLLFLWLCSLFYLLSYAKSKQAGLAAKAGPFLLQAVSLAAILLLWPKFP